MRSYAALVAAFAATAVSAQEQNYTSSLEMEIDPNSVEDSLRANWCVAQDNTCNQLCDDSTSTNQCDYVDLSYNCTCSSNDSAPGLQYYTQTLPTFICMTLYDQCMERAGGTQNGEEACQTEIQDLCGKQAPSSADDNDDDDNDDSEEGDAEETDDASTSGTQAPTETSDEPEATNTDEEEDDGSFAAGLAIPEGIAALFAAGALAALI